MIILEKPAELIMVLKESLVKNDENKKIFWNLIPNHEYENGLKIESNTIFGSLFRISLLSNSQKFIEGHSKIYEEMISIIGNDLESIKSESQERQIIEKYENLQNDFMNSVTSLFKEFLTPNDIESKTVFFQ